MCAWDPTQPLPHQAADAFAVLYDWLSGDPYELIENSPKHYEVPLDPQTVELAKHVAENGWATPQEIKNVLLEVANSDDEKMAIEVFRCIIAIDRGFRAFHPQYQSSFVRAKSLGPYENWQLYGCFNTEEVDGFVLPLWTRPYREETSLGHHCQHLIRVNVNRRRLSVIARGHSSFRPRVDEPMEVAIVPFLYSLDDATFIGHDHADTHHFSIRHNMETPPNLQQRIESAVEAVRSKQVNIAVFPELALNDDLLETLCASLKRTLTPSSKLQWVIAGTLASVGGREPFDMANMAVVLNGSGEVISGETLDGELIEWKQYKRHRYTLSAEEQQRYGIESCFGKKGTECDREEAISIGRQRILVDDISGRFTVLICEDWGADIEAYDYLRSSLPSAVFVIVMDGPLLEHRWAAVRAKDVAERTNALAVLANSLLLPNRPNCISRLADKHSIPDPLPDGQQLVGRLYGPSTILPEDSKAPDKHKFCSRATPDSSRNDSLISNSIALPLTSA